ncbi:MAG: GntR family transcriptional regulator [Verrucomicrobia bacterium]|nr:GntR family transcriptional regulator [Verrucomicrobiota bacterium]
MKKVNSDVAYEFIRKKILSGGFPPGYPLMTEALSALTKVSRTPVREALHRLKAEGLVTIRARLGASVKKMDLKEFRETCDLRLALESHAAGLAALNHSSADLREIKFALDGMRTTTGQILAAKNEAPYIDELLQQDVRFHIAIMTAAKNDLIKGEILRLHLVNRVSVRPSQGAQPFATKGESDANRRKVLASHEEIYEGIAKGNAAVAKLAMEKHIQDIIDKSVPAFHAASEDSPRGLTEEEMAYTS